LTLLGCENSTILLKKEGEIWVDSAIIAFEDSAFAIDWESSFRSKEDLQLINEGKIYLFSTGAEGEFNF
jgi:hypothetical protein